jgi:hypothetical protein
MEATSEWHHSVKLSLAQCYIVEECAEMYNIFLITIQLQLQHLSDEC